MPVPELVDFDLQAQAQAAASKAETDRKSADKAKAAADKGKAAADTLAASLKKSLSGAEEVGHCNTAYCPVHICQALACLVARSGIVSLQQSSLPRPPHDNVKICRVSDICHDALCRQGMRQQSRWRR